MKDKLNENQHDQLNGILDKLYKLEDSTMYENSNIGEAINLLQKEL